MSNSSSEESVIGECGLLCAPPKDVLGFLGFLASLGSSYPLVLSLIGHRLFTL